jgi:hypothetical protein
MISLSVANEAPALSDQFFRQKRVRGLGYPGVRGEAWR